MEIFEFIFYLGVINIIFSAIWKILATIFSSVLQDVGIDKDVSFFIFKAVGYYILVSITALITSVHMQGTYTLAAVSYAVVGTFVIYATIASNLERNRWRAVMNFERKRIRVMRYDGYLLMACILLFISTLIKPDISNFRFQEWVLASIDKIYRAPVLKYIIGFFAFFYMLNIIFRGIKASDEVLAVLFNRKRKKPDEKTARMMEQDFRIMKKLFRMSPANQNNNSSRSVYVRNNILRTIIFFSLFFSITICKAQTIQWASELVRFSTETSRTQYAAKQALGPPNKLPATGESVVAWAPSTPENPNGEFIHVRFATPMHVKQIAIGENNGPGAVKEIILFSVDGEKHSVYKNENIKPEYITGGRMFRQFIPLTDYLVDEVKVILNTQAIAGMNQIDCIGISDSEEPITAKINEAVYDEIIPAPENLGPNINSTADDMFAFISPDGQTLYFARKNYIENFGDAKRDDIYISHWVNNAWTKAENAGAPLNNDQHNYVSWISPDGTTLMLANNYEVVKQDISISKKTGSGWSFPKALKVNDFYNQSHFSCYHMNTEGNVILMNIERPDSKGDMDIYVSFLKPNKVWSEPKNIGNIINTVGIEASIFIASDNKTIYFSTNGKSGYGGFDMFMSKRLDDTWLNWSEPVNLGKQINTAGEEYFYTVPASGDYIYFSSTTNSYGKADLFRIKLPQPLQPEPVTLLKGKIIDADTKKEITADIEFGGLRGEESSGISTTSASDYQIIIPEDNYHVTIKKEGYVPSFKNYEEQLDYDDADFNSTDSISVIKHQIKNDLKPELKNSSVNRDELMKTIREKVDEEFGDTSGMKEQIVEDLTKELTGNLHNDSTYEVVQENIEMIPIKEGTVIRLNNIFFEANKADLKPESLSSLDELASFLMENKNIYAEIGGHTNGLPGDDFCQKLSNDRAKAVTDYLILKGVRSDHLTWKGYGKTIPLATNATVEGRKKNQRVELKIIKVD